MKKFLFILLNLFLSGAFAEDCNLPCGAEQLIQCAAKNSNLSSEDFFNKKLFYHANIDGFCKNRNQAQVRTQQQKFFYEKFCQHSNDSSYLSYANFIKAASYFPTFACEGSSDDRYKELSGFLTTIAQETSSKLYNYTNDGLYFRYENSALRGYNLSNKTSYYPDNRYIVGINSNGEVYSQKMWFGTLRKGAQVYDLTTTPERIYWGKVDIPQGFKPMVLNKLVLPGYWIGMGPIQLTGGVLIEFLGWYNNEVLNDETGTYNLDEFIARYMYDGQMAFAGAFWYWMNRVSAAKYKTLHQMVTNTAKPVCHDIGAITPVVNGGCQGYNPGRVNYYKYFCNLFDVDVNPIKAEVSYNNTPLKLNSMECSKNIRLYCQK